MSHHPLDAHCGRAGCACAHSYGCYRGWIDYLDPDGIALTQPCSQCRPNLLRRVKDVPPPGQRHHEYDQQRLRRTSREESA